MTIARNLAAYLPVTLTRHILAAGLPQPGEANTLTAAALFSDISGFTAMSEELAADGPRGAEELNRILLLTFTGMIDVIHEMGGAVNHFHGDAMSVYFPDEDGHAARRALACAQMMQRLMAVSLSRIVANRPPGKQAIFTLTMKIGVGYGRCQELVVGDPARIMEYVIAGDAVEEAAAAEKFAQSGQIVASQTALAQVGRSITVPFAVFPDPEPGVSHDWPAPRPLLDWEQAADDDLERLATAVSPFIPAVIYERTASGLVEMAEHRPVTSLFVQFDCREQEFESKETWLQHYYQWATEMVARFGGQNARVNRVLTGDKGNQLHIIFGAPVAPDAPDQAIRCALAMQRERPAFVAQQRIGLTTGKVFASPVGAERRREYTVVGDVVNLSARLTQACADGQVLTDKATADRVRELIDFEELPPVHLKGKQAKVTPCHPRGDRRTGDQGAQAQLQVFVNRWQRPLVGRDAELDLLLGGMDMALRGVGGVAAVFGSTGVGKTSLMAAGVKHWLAAGGAALAGEGQQHTSDIPFGPWISVWRDFLGLTPGMDDAAQVTAVVNRTKALVPDCGDDVGLWGDVLGLPFPQADNLADLSAEVRQARFFVLARRAFQAAAASQPLLIVLEGLHWADTATLAFVDELSSHQEGHAIFLGLTFRPIDRLDLKTLTRALCTPIALSDLPPKHARALLNHLVGVTELPKTVEQHLGLRGRDGLESPVNPLFLEEAVNVMKGLGALQVNGRVQVNESLLTQMQIPDTIHGLLLARIDRLPVASRDLLQVASVIGRQFDLEPLVSITPKTPRDVAADLLADLSAEEITQLMTTDPEWSYLFQHAMTHEVAYESLPFARRQTLHAAVADWLAARYVENLKPLFAVLAYHYSRAGNHVDGLRYALAAADSARDIFANREAVDLYTLAEEHLLALDEEEQWETAVHIYLNRGDAFRLLGEFLKAIDDAEQALALSTQNQALAPAAQARNLLAHLKYNQSNYEETLALAEQVIAARNNDIPQAELARANLWSGMAAASQSDFTNALAKLQEAESICLTINDKQTLADVLSAVAFVHYSQKNLEPALQTMLRAVILSRNFSTPAKIGFILNNIALIQLNLGYADEALDALNETASLAADTSENLLAYAVVNRAEVYAYLGQFRQAQHDLEQAINLFTLMDDDFGLVEGYLLLGYEYHPPLNEWKEAETALRQAQRLIETKLDSYTEQQVRLLIGLARVKLAAGAVEEAYSYLRTAEKIIANEKLTWWLPATAYLLGKTSQKMGNLKAAESYFLKVMSAVEEGGRPEYLPLALLEMGKLTADTSQMLSLLHQSLVAAEKRARIHDRRICYLEAGAILAKSDVPRWQELGRHYLELAETLTGSQRE